MDDLYSCSILIQPRDVRQRVRSAPLTLGSERRRTGLKSNARVAPIQIVQPADADNETAQIPTTTEVDSGRDIESIHGINQKMKPSNLVSVQHQ